MQNVQEICTLKKKIQTVNQEPGFMGLLGLGGRGEVKYNSLAHELHYLLVAERLVLLHPKLTFIPTTQKEGM